MMAPGIVAATALCFLVSFDEVVITLFLTGPRLDHIAGRAVPHVEEPADPLGRDRVGAADPLTLAVVLIVDRSVGLSKTSFVK